MPRRPKALRPQRGLGKAIRFLREESKMSGSTLAERAELSASWISRIEGVKPATNVTKVEVMQMTRSWNSSVTWNRASTGVSWREGAKGDFKALSPATSVSTAQRGSQAGPWSFGGNGILDLVEGWRSGRGGENNFGLMLKLPDESPHVCCFERRAEWESSTGTNKPYLAAQYVLPAPPKSKMASPTDGTTTAKRFRLVAEWDEPIVEGVTFQYKTGNAWLDIPADQVIDEDGKAVTWPYKVDKPVEDRKSKPLFWDASGLPVKDGTAEVKIRAVLNGSPGASGYTKAVAGIVDQDLGGTKDATSAVGPGVVNLLTGNFSVSRTDVSIPGFESALQFSRTISSRDIANGRDATVLGEGWRPSSPVEAAGSTWRSLKIESETVEVEEEVETYKWATLTHSDGHQVTFDIDEDGNFLPSDALPGSALYRQSESLISLTDPNGNKTVFSNFGQSSGPEGYYASEYLPLTVSQPAGPDSKTRLIYTFSGEKAYLKRVIASADDDIVCTDEGATTTKGCRVLEFSYENAKAWGGSESLGWRLSRIYFYAPGLGGSSTVASYGYDSAGRLITYKDPRANLQESYSYESTGQLKTLTPPGEEPWTFSYGKLPGDSTSGRLLSIKRPSLVPSAPTAQTTIAYGVPITGSSAPYDMSRQEISKWGQEDIPVDATAIFPPDEVPGSPPSSYGHATVYYMDAEGQTVNSALPAPPGAGGPSISTTETDEFGNVNRELTPQNRLRALAAGPEGSAPKSKELDTQFKYSADGLVMVDERGPIHAVRVETGPQAGEIVQARSYRSIQYDKGAPEPKEGETWPLLPTSETAGALVAGEVMDQNSVQYIYSWNLRKPVETFRDPEGLKIRSVTKYQSEFGGVEETRQPKDAENPGAGSTRVVYYNWRSQYESESAAECHSRVWAGRVCKVLPVAQPSSGPDRSTLHYRSYNALGKPTEVVEEVAGPTPGTRTRINTYDSAGRVTSTQTSGGGTLIPKLETVYDTSKGVPAIQRFVCPIAEPSCDRETITTTYDALGRVASYQDADGNEAKTTYDVNGRPVTFNDGKGTQTFGYDPPSGMPVTLTDSMAGTFTATYNADGRMIKRQLPNGLTAETVLDAAGNSTDLTYTKASPCGASCTWLDFEVSRSISGKILSETGTLGTNEFSYDRLGRLTQAEETPAGGECTTRSYGYDENSNRTSKTSLPPGLGGMCSSSGGSTQTYGYDGADRLQNAGLVYDAFGRITTMPSALAGGSTLVTSYFSNDMIASQSQGGVTNTFALDATLRQRQRTQGGGLEGVEVFHYANGSDSPAWSQLGEGWTRNITGIGGELAAVAKGGSSTRLQLSNLHGDIVATSSTSPFNTEMTLAAMTDEFGNPLSGTPDRFGWMGGAQRRTEFPSGVIQMGARSYVPAVGRFLSSDPIVGGSANAYDYANADPVNQFDPSGKKPHDNDCDGGIVPHACQVWLHIRMWSPRGGRMGVRMIYKSNRIGGISRIAFDINYWVDEKDDIYKEGFVEMPPPHYLNTYPGVPDSCRSTDPCANNHDGRGTFACRPGNEYQIKITFKYRYNIGDQVEEAQVLEVQAQEFCTYS